MILSASALTLTLGRGRLEVPTFDAGAGDALCFVPSHAAMGADAALARVFCTLREPATGHVTFWGEDVSRLEYMALLALRPRLGFVPGHGGLLSNRSLRENVALPISVHRKRELSRVDEQLARFDLLDVADRRPHEVDGATRFRACAARALVLAPALVVVEGSGDFEADAGPSRCWSQLSEARSRGAVLVVCLARPHAAFTRWFEAQGGHILTLGSEETT